MNLAAIAVIGAGALLLLAGVLRRRGDARVRSLAALLDLPGAPLVDPRSMRSARLGRIAEVFRSERFGGARAPRLRDQLRDLAARPGDAALAAGLVVVAALFVALLTGRVALGVVVVLGLIVTWSFATRRRHRRRAQRIAAQFPDALSVIASSLQAGNPLLRSLQILAERGAEPLSSEIRRIIAETELGSPLVDAVDRMAERVVLDDIRWFARALRIQQMSGGQLAPLVRTVADVMTARAELHREARALSAEGRMSAWVLGALPVLLVAACQAMNPDYLAPLFRGWGWAVVAACAASIMAGIAWILRMVDGEGVA